MIIHVCFFKDHVQILNDIALKRGMIIDKNTNNLDQRKHNYTLPADDPLLQKEDIISSDKLWIPITIFYVFSLFWYIAYFKLIFTDIAVAPNNTDANGSTSQSETLLCHICKVQRRSDIYHCYACGVCSELHDHHCDIL